MPQLKFYARADSMVAVPGTTAFAGQVSRYLGRETKVENAGTPEEIVSYPATEAGFTCDTGSQIGDRAMKLTRRDFAFWPADPDTAAACGVPFTPVEFNAGVWTEKSDAVEGES